MDLRKVVKHKLIDLGKTQKWLEEEVARRTGLFMDGGYMHKVLTGQRSAPKIVNAIYEILGIEENAEP